MVSVLQERKRHLKLEKWQKMELASRLQGSYIEEMVL